MEAGNAMARGIRKALADTDLNYEVQVFPAADGGEGTAETLCAALHGTLHRINTVDLFGHFVQGTYADLPGDVSTAAMDMATCCGIGFARQYGPDPMTASTYGVGLMIRKMAEMGYRRILVGLGGSGTNDGGIGALGALGAVFTDEAGYSIDPRLGGKMLSRIRHMDVSAVHSRLAGTKLELLYDAAVPLTGDSGATRMFGAQKGASPADLEALESGMLRFAKCIDDLYGAEIPMTKGSGAAGGLGCGLMLAGGKLCHGASHILDALGIPALLQNTVLVFTGEGKTDQQTTRGKLPHTVARYAKAAGVPCVDICGQAEPGDMLYTDGMTAVVSLANGCITLEESMAKTAYLAEKTAYNLTRLWLAGK